MKMKKEHTKVPFRPVTVADHQQLGEQQQKKNRTAVSDALGFPVGSRFDEDLTALLESHPEDSDDVIAIALIDCDEFLHINEDFGTEEGDRVLIETGKYLASRLPEEAAVYRIGGDEFGLIFNGPMEREEIFLFLNDLKNGYQVTTLDGVRQTVTIGMATAFEDASRCAELIRKADGALYRAKKSGRDRVAMAREEKMVPKTSHYTQDQLQRLAKLSKREEIGEAILLREALDMLLKKYDV